MEGTGQINHGARVEEFGKTVCGLFPIAVSTEAAFMLALKPDMVRIELGGFEYSASKVLIGLDGGTLSGDRAYRAIISGINGRRGYDEDGCQFKQAGVRWKAQIRGGRFIAQWGTGPESGATKNAG